MWLKRVRPRHMGQYSIIYKLHVPPTCPLRHHPSRAKHMYFLSTSSCLCSVSSRSTEPGPIVMLVLVKALCLVSRLLRTAYCVCTPHNKLFVELKKQAHVLWEIFYLIHHWSELSVSFPVSLLGTATGPCDYVTTRTRNHSTPNI